MIFTEPTMHVISSSELAVSRSPEELEGRPIQSAILTVSSAFPVVSPSRPWRASIHVKNLEGILDGRSTAALYQRIQTMSVLTTHHRTNEPRSKADCDGLRFVSTVPLRVR